MIGRLQCLAAAACADAQLVASGDVVHGLVTSKSNDTEPSKQDFSAGDGNQCQPPAFAVSILSRRSILSSFYRASLVWRDELAGAERNGAWSAQRRTSLFGRHNLPLARVCERSTHAK